MTERRESWGQLACVLNCAERVDYWRDTAASFTEWLEGLSTTLGVKPATLWRYLSAGRFYNSMRKELLAEGISAPPLEGLPDSVSPENLELLAKLRRVAPQEVTDPIAAKVLTGAITRADLRSTWQVYRPALGGRTARGRGVEVPKLDSEDTWRLDSLREAEVFTSLKYGSRAWTGTATPHSFHIYLKVRPELGPDDQTTIEFDAVVAVRSKAEGPLVLHGFEIRSELSPYLAQGVNFWKVATPFCDRLWTAVHETTLGIDGDVVPTYVGVVVARAQAITVLRAATVDEKLGTRSGDLAKGLLSSTPAQ